MNDMKERPILFNGEMVRAILNGHKTQTRRPIAPQPPNNTTWDQDAGLFVVDGSRLGLLRFCPFGVPGDRLWVRETWAHYQTVDSIRRPDGRSYDEVSDGLAGYRADGHDSIEDFREHIRLTSGCSLQDVVINGDKWRPSIRMPRWASRITLEVTDVRVERVQEIDRFDAIAEGIRWTISDENTVHVYEASKQTRERFRELWDSINVKRGYGWDVNPWVWVVEFERIVL